MLISKSVKCWNLKKFATAIFKFKIGLSSEFMNYIFKFITKSSSLQINLQFWPEDPNEEIWHRNGKIWHRIFSKLNVKLLSGLWILRQKCKCRSQKSFLKSYAKCFMRNAKCFMSIYMQNVFNVFIFIP